MAEQSSIAFCIDAPLLDWREVLDRNDSFIYQAKRFSEIANTSLVLIGDSGKMQNGNLGIYFENTDKSFLSRVKSLKPDVIVHLASLQRPFNKVIAKQFPFAMKVLFWAGGEWVDEDAATYFDHIAVHHPWQAPLFAETNRISKEVVSDIQGGVDLDMFKPSEEIERKTRAIYPSNVFEYKRQHLAAMACETLGLPLVLSGYTINQIYVDALCKFKCVDYRGRIPHNLLPKEYIASAVAPITTPMEAGPHVLVEAMACETIPIVCGDCFTTSMVMKNAGLDELIANPDYYDIGDKMSIALSDTEHYSKDLRKYVETHYDLSKKFEAFKQLLKKEGKL